MLDGRKASLLDVPSDAGVERVHDRTGSGGHFGPYAVTGNHRDVWHGLTLVVKILVGAFVVGR